MTDLQKLADAIQAEKPFPAASGEYAAGYAAGRYDAWLKVQEAADDDDVHADGLLEAAKGLKRIVEEIDGAMKHGTWRDEHGVRLKDTPEWVAFYLAISAAIPSQA